MFKSSSSSLLRNIIKSTRLSHPQVGFGINRTSLINSSYHTSVSSFANAAAAETKRTEKDLAQILENNFLNGENKPIIRVNDISGGCGAMFDILVVSNKFEGQPLVKQHKMVMEILKKDIQSMHGLTINTKTPKQYEDIIKKK